MAIRRPQKRIIALQAAAILVVLAMYWFRVPLNEGLSCLLYYDQCTAMEVEGLTSQQCFSRSDAVAYLTQRNVCLVRPSE